VPDEKLMETDDVARYLNVHRKTVINLVERGELRGYRVGRNWRFRKSDVDEYLERQQEPKPDDRRRDDG
jgi:excisionase family DNA binding protein